uniref:Uncharacterized protein n=1 Tax=Plectus sambesii TaxID=2011161 RepID=A0A914UW07_9BILA
MPDRLPNNNRSSERAIETRRGGGKEPGARRRRRIEMTAHGRADRGLGGKHAQRAVLAIAPSTGRTTTPETIEGKLEAERSTVVDNYQRVASAIRPQLTCARPSPSCRRDKAKKARRRLIRQTASSQPLRRRSLP